MFRAFEAELVQKCGGNGGVCHVKGTFSAPPNNIPAPTWLADPDPYISAKNYPGNIPVSGDINDSKLLTQIEHEGPALVSSPALFEAVKAWIEAEIAARGPMLPATDPFTVTDGANTIDLTKLTGGLAGAKITFNASSNATNHILTILNMQITAPFAKGLHIETPYFIIIPAAGPVITDELDAPGGPPLDVLPAQTVSFFDGSSILQKWDPAGKLKIVFHKFDVMDPPDAGIPTSCKSVATFTSSAVPGFALDLGNGQTCLSCHGQADAGNAGVLAMDLTKVGTDNGAACAQAITHADLTNRPRSQLILTPIGDPAGDPDHPVKAACATSDGGTPCVQQAYIDGIVGWLANE
jgi:hypothetical protein